MKNNLLNFIWSKQDFIFLICHLMLIISMHPQQQRVWGPVDNKDLDSNLFPVRRIKDVK